MIPLNRVRAGAAVLVTMAVGACATIASGTTQMITVESNVEGAEIYLDGERIGSTPFTGVVKKNRSALRLEADGYQSQTVSLSKSLDPKFWGNIILGGTLGSITDYATGAAYQYAPATYQVEMRSEGQTFEDFSEQLVLRKFAMLYVNEIARDLGEGGGGHVAALSELLTQARGDAVTVREIERALEESHGDPVEFGSRVVALRK